jgi:hypothetical protein
VGSALCNLKSAAVPVKRIQAAVPRVVVRDQCDLDSNSISARYSITLLVAIREHRSPDPITSVDFADVDLGCVAPNSDTPCQVCWICWPHAFFRTTENGNEHFAPPAAR